MHIECASSQPSQRNLSPRSKFSKSSFENSQDHCLGDHLELDLFWQKLSK